MNTAHALDFEPASGRLLPPDDPQRADLHNEVHARPSARIRLPALVVYVAVLNEGVSREAECAHLNRLVSQAPFALLFPLPLSRWATDLLP